MVVKNTAFTLIELLIVMAILGVLAVISLVLINPVERLAQSRDTGRIGTVSQLGRALQAYYTTNESVYPNEATWANDLVSSAEITIFPAGIKYSVNGVTGCTSYVQPAVNPTFCYDLDTVGSDGVIVFAVAESTSHRSKCMSPEQAYFVYSTADGRGGTVCSSGDPTVWAPGTKDYVN